MDSPDLVWLRVLWDPWYLRDAQRHTGLGFKGLNLNLGGVHWQQRGHMHGHWHRPFGGFFLQHSQPGLLTQAPNMQGNVRPEQRPQPQPPQPMGGPKPPLTASAHRTCCTAVATTVTAPATPNHHRNRSRNRSHRIARDHHHIPNDVYLQGEKRRLMRGRV